MRIIDADKLINQIEQHCIDDEVTCKDDVIEIIDNAPTVELCKHERPTGKFDLIKRAVLIFCRNVRPDGNMSYFDWEDRCKLQDIYHELINESDDERSEE